VSMLWTLALFVITSQPWDGWMAELELYVLYFCTGKANRDSHGPKTMRWSAPVLLDEICCPTRSVNWKLRTLPSLLGPWACTSPHVPLSGI
jgi:hypothetical protein